MKRIFVFLPVFCALLLTTRFAAAQSAFDVFGGAGTAWNSRLGFIDQSTLLSCTGNNSGCVQTPKLGGTFLGFGMDLMLSKWLGVGGEYKFQVARHDYVVFQQQGPGVFGDVLQTRTGFYDFNAILQPISAKRASVQFQGGLGGANVRFHEKFTSSGSVLGNTNQSQFLGSTNHFQLHAGVGVNLFATEHIFIRPQLDLHYVHNFKDQFGRNAVPAVMIWVGYSLGEH